MSPSHRTRRNPVAWVMASVLLLAAVIASFWVPLYARSMPKLGALPFFYWYQLILVPAVAIASWIAYLLIRSEPGSVQASDTSAARPSGPPAVPAEGGPEAAL
jgi:uncharacterized protein DUF3311